MDSLDPDDPDNRFLRSGATLENIEKDFADWHQGRSHYYIWVLLIDDPQWHVALANAAWLLRPYLHCDYCRQPHITILPAGFLTSASIAIQSLADICSQTPPITLQLGKLTSFTSAPYIAVEEPSMLVHRVRARLQEMAFDPDGVVMDHDYVPHLTVGIYNGTYPARDVMDCINKAPATAAEQTTVKYLTLARYQTSTIKGRLEAVATAEFETGKIQLHKQHSLFSAWHPEAI